LLITLISRRPGLALGSTVISTKTSSVWERTAGVRSSSANLFSIRSISFSLATCFSGLAASLFASFSLGLGAWGFSNFALHLLQTLASGAFAVPHTRQIREGTASDAVSGPMGVGNSNEAIQAAIASSTVVSFFRNSFSCW